MTRALLLALVACGSKAEPPPAVLDLTCPAVVRHVAELTLRPIDYARPREPAPAISETDPRAFRQRRVDQAIAKACNSRDIGAYGPCAREVVLAEMAAECVDREWSDERRQCLVAARDAAALEACGPAPAPVLPASPAARPVPTKALGEDCIADADCELPARCVMWMSEGGEQRAQCEIPCGRAPDHRCPAGRRCVSQAGAPDLICVPAK